MPNIERLTSDAQAGRNAAFRKVEAQAFANLDTAAKAETHGANLSLFWLDFVPASSSRILEKQN